MTRINIKEFVLLLDGAQDEDTDIIINIDGEEIASGTVGEALNQIESSNPDSNLYVKSFTVFNMNLIIECEILR